MIQGLSTLAYRIIRVFYSILIVLPIALIGNIFAQAILFYVWMPRPFGRKDSKDSKEVLLQCKLKLRETNDLAFSYIKESFCVN